MSPSLFPGYDNDFYNHVDVVKNLESVNDKLNNVVFTNETSVGKSILSIIHSII